jgi:hypothetical protein
MSPVVVIGFGAIDAALIAQGLYGIRDYRRAARNAGKERNPAKR